MLRTYVIVGAGVAGASAAEALRGVGFDGRIVLVGADQNQPYQRPPLSKELLRGEVAPDFATLRTLDFYADNAIELLLGERAIIEPRFRRVNCGRGVQIEYDKVLIATGGTPRELHVPGGELPGVHYLRTLNQAISLKKEFERRPRVLVVGSGFIGCEVAASARKVGCEVVIASPTLPMAHALGSEVGQIYANYHRGQGVELKTGVTVTEFQGAGLLEEAVLSDGSRTACSVAVVGIGMAPSEGTLRELETQEGFITDEFCQTTINNVFAAGDAAYSWRPRLNRYARLEHFENAQLQGAAAARNMCGASTPYDPIPFFWSDRYGFSLQYYGNTIKWDEVILRGRPDQGSFIAFYLQNGRVEAACLVNRSKYANPVKQILGLRVPQKLLADDDVALIKLATMEVPA